MSTRRSLRLFELCKEKTDNFVAHFLTSTGGQIEVKISGKIRRSKCYFKITFISRNEHVLCNSYFVIKKFAHVERYQKLLNSFVLGFS